MTGCDVFGRRGCRMAAVLAAVFFLVVLGGATLVRAANQAPSRPAGGDEVRLILEAFTRQAKDLERDLAAFRTEISKELDGVEAAYDGLMRRKSRLMLWRAMADDPWSLRDVIQGNDLLLSNVGSIMERPERALSQLDRFAMSLDAFGQRLKDQLGSGVAPEYEDDIRTIKSGSESLSASVQALRANIEARLGPLREFQADASQAGDRLDEHLSEVWKAYYTTRAPTLSNLDAVGNLAQAVHDWRGSFDLLFQIIGQETPASEILAHLGVALGSGLAVWFVGLLLIHRGLRRWAPTPRSIRRLRQTLACLAVSLAFTIVAQLTHFFLYAILLSAGEVFLAAGLVCLTRFLRLADNPDGVDPPPILWPLWRLFALGLMFQALETPEVWLGPLMALFLILTAWSFRKKRLTVAPDQTLDRLLTSGLSLCLPLLALAALFGYPQVAVLVTSGLFYVAVSLRLASASIGFMARFEALGHDGRPPVWIGVLSGAGFPVVFLGYVFACLWLLSTQFAGESVFLEAFSFEARYESFAISLKKVVLLVLGYYVFKAGILVSESFIRDITALRRGVDKGAAATLLTVTRYLWWGGYIVTALGILGLSMSNVAMVAGGLSVGIGFGMQNLVNNFISGLILLFSRPIQVGDTIQLGETMGVVKEVNIRNTEVLTVENATLFVPNSELVSGRIINWSHRDPSARRDVKIGVAYGSDIALVRDLLLLAARRHPRVLASPAPAVLHLDFGASSLDFALRVFVRDVSDAVTVLSDLRADIEALFREHEVEISFPQTDLHVRSAPALERLLGPLIGPGRANGMDGAGGADGANKEEAQGERKDV